MSTTVRRAEIHNRAAIGVVFEPHQASEHFAVMLGGGSAGIHLSGATIQEKCASL